jgi:DNA polymerase-1
MNYLISNNPEQKVYDGLTLTTLEEIIPHLKAQIIVGFDTETTGLRFDSEELLLVQISSKEHNYLIDAQSVDLQPIKGLFESPRIIKIAHNVKFDYKFLKFNGITCENTYDTMLAEQVLNCGKTSLRNSLKDLLERYLDIFMDKKTRSTFIGHKGAFSKAQLFYGIDDTSNLIKLRELQLESIKDLNLEEVVQLENDAALAFADIEYNGIYLDKDKWEENYNGVKIDLDNAVEELDMFIEHDPTFKKHKLPFLQMDMFKPIEEIRKTDILWSSPAQVLDLFQTVSPLLESVNGKLLLMHTEDHPIISKYIKYKEKAKLYNAYGPDFYKYLHNDGCVHTNFKQILNTGRVSSSKPNMQQIPASNSYRNAFTPGHKNWVFVSSDFSSQELCIIAYGSQDPVWLDALKEGKDLHSICADLIFGQVWRDAEGDDKERKRLRTAVKAINFGLAYGMSEFKLADTLQITIEEAKEMIDKYFTVFPSIKKFLTQLGNFGKDNGYIRTFKPYRRIRWFEEWENNKRDFAILGSIERASKNTPIQGTGADMTKLALIKVRKVIALNNYPVRLVMTVHDQIDTVSHEGFAEEWSGILKNTMEEAALHIIDNGLLKSDTNISLAWEK